MPDAGPLITLSYADALDLLLRPGWEIAVVDMVLHEVTRNHTPTSEKLCAWIRSNEIPIVSTRIFTAYQDALARGDSVRKANLGEIAIQDAMNSIAIEPDRRAVFLFEDHKIARDGFVLPQNCRKVSTRSFLLFLETEGLIESAEAVERDAIQAGRKFASIRFP